MKGIVIYDSKYGSAKQYAQWIGEDARFETIDIKRVKSLEGYDCIVIGTWVMAEKPNAGKWILKNWKKLKDKKVVLYTTSGADKNDPVQLKNFENFFPEEIAKKIRYFPLNGRMIFSKMNWLDRTLMNMVIKIVAKKEPEKAAKMGLDFDRVNRSDIKIIVDELKK